MNSNFNLLIASRVLALLDERKARLYPDGKSFYVWPRADRVIVIFDTAMIDLGKLNADFGHRLSTRLQGRPVVRTNTRGLFLQIGYKIPPALSDMTSMPLNMSAQPTPYSMPIGSTFNGSDLWVSLMEGDSFLVAGSRGMGKTGFIHGCIQALLHGGAVQVYGFDGKSGVEFSRYMGIPMFSMVHDLGKTLSELKTIAVSRRRKLLSSGQPNILLYNEKYPDEPMLPIALFIDEAALTNDEEKAGLVEIVERERDTGFYPVLATNRPEASALLVKSNLVTRICFPVPSWNASQMVLGQNGAESLPKEQGRGLIVYKARVTEFQSFRVTYPEPTDDAVKMMLERDQLPVTDDTQVVIPTSDTRVTIPQMAEKIRELWSPELSKNKIATLLGFSQYGGSYRNKVDAVIEYLTSTTTTNGQELPNFGVLEA